MNQYEIKEALQIGKRIYGTCLSSPSPKMAMQLKNANLDFVFIDTEHCPFDRTQVSWMCQVFRNMNVAPFVRIPSHSPYEACAMLDGGAAGIIAPYIETVEQVQQLRGAVKYRPLKGEKLQRVLDGTYKLTEEEVNFFKRYNQEHLLILNIESRAAVDHIDEILAVPDIDAIFIGPHDLSINLGKPEDYENPEWEDYISTTIKKCLEHNVGVGNHFSFDIEKQINWAKQGMNILIWNVDSIRIVQALNQDFSHIKDALEEDIGEVGIAGDI